MELDADRAGFHAVIGNPPYEVLSSKETGTDVDVVLRVVGEGLAAGGERVAVGVGGLGEPQHLL